jgi:inosine-uridine nucleoside N-ribohydrolase
MTSLIIDTDPGVDDAFALALACASPEVTLLGVTTVFGNVGLASTTRNALGVLALCGREDVPVAAGAERPLVHGHPHRARYAHGQDGLSGRAGTLPERRTGLAGVDAVTLMLRLLDEASEPVTIVPLGPLTNIAALLAAHPGVRGKIARLVIMGGAVDGGNVTASAEFNVWSDPEAARRVLTEESLPTVLVPTDLTLRCAVDRQWLDTLAGSGDRGATLVGLTEAYQEYYRKALGREAMVIHDAVAVAEAVRPGLLRTTRLPVDVECSFGPTRGKVVVDRRAAEVREESSVDGSVDVALDADIDEVRTFLLDRLTT